MKVLKSRYVEKPKTVHGRCNKASKFREAFYDVDFRKDSTDLSDYYSYEEIQDTDLFSYWLSNEDEITDFEVWMDCENEDWRDEKKQGGWWQNQFSNWFDQSGVEYEEEEPTTEFVAVLKQDTAEARIHFEKDNGRWLQTVEDCDDDFEYRKGNFAGYLTPEDILEWLKRDYDFAYIE